MPRFCHLPLFRPNGQVKFTLNIKKLSIKTHKIKKIVWITSSGSFAIEIIAYQSNENSPNVRELLLTINPESSSVGNDSPSRILPGSIVSSSCARMETQRFSTWLVIKSRSGGGHRQHPAFVNGAILLISRVEVARLLILIQTVAPPPEERIFEIAREREEKNIFPFDTICPIGEELGESFGTDPLLVQDMK